MSIKLNQTIKGVPGEKIYRIESVTLFCKPNESRYAIINGNIYASEDAKNSSQPIDSFSRDIRDQAAVDVVLASPAQGAAYDELKKPGCIFNGGIDC